MPALEKGLDIFEALVNHPDGLTGTELAAATGRSIGEIFRVLQVLERRGYLRRHPASDRYFITYRLLDLGHRATPARTLAAVAQPVMHALAMHVVQSCHLVVGGEGKALVIAQQPPPGPTGLSVQLGAELDLFASCSGIVLLAFTAPERLQGLTDGAPIPRDLQTILPVIRGQGYAHRDSLRTEGVRDISYPVFGFDGHLKAALTLPYLKLIDGSQTMDEAQTREALASAAAEISLGLGHVDA
ncbi:IclR family transcriptional regulator [Sphingomonas sp. RS2018]